MPPGGWCPTCPRCSAWARALETPSPRRPTSTGTSISPAPCAEAMRKDQSTSSPRPDPHADPARVAEAGGDLVGGEGEQRRAAQRQEQPLRDHQPERADRNGGQADGQGVAEGDRPQGRRRRPAAAAPAARARRRRASPSPGSGRERRPGPASESQGQNVFSAAMMSSPLSGLSLLHLPVWRGGARRARPRGPAVYG